jgi:hypothetical protein
MRIGDNLARTVREYMLTPTCLVVRHLCNFLAARWALVILEQVRVDLPVSAAVRVDRVAGS